MSAGAKITYTSTSGDLERLPPSLRRGARERRAAAGRRHLNWIGGEAVESAAASRWWIVRRSTPSVVLGTFAAAGPAEVDRAVRAARGGATLLGAPALAGAARDPPARGRPDSGAEVRARGDHEPRGREEPAGGDGRRGGDRRPDRLLLRSGRGGRRLRPADGPAHPDRAQHRRAPARTGSSPASRRSTFRWRSRPACRPRRWWPATRWSTSRPRTRPGPGSRLYEIYRDAGVPAGRVQLPDRPPRGDRRCALAAPRRRRRRVHRLEGGRDADPPGPERSGGSSPV